MHIRVKVILVKMMTMNIVDFIWFVEKIHIGKKIQIFWAFINSQIQNCVPCIVNYLNACQL
jgi:hypothetical protein